MSWNKYSENGFLIAKETITLSTDSTDKSTSVIDFVPAGQDFLIGTKPSTALSGTGLDVDIDVCDTSSGTFGTLKADLATADANVYKFTNYDISANGQAPYYKVRLDPDTGMASASVTVFVVVPPPIRQANFV